MYSGQEWENELRKGGHGYVLKIVTERPQNSPLSRETGYWNSSVCFVLSQRKSAPQHHRGCLDKFGRPRRESPEKNQSLGVIIRSLQGVLLCENKSHNQRVWQSEVTLEMIPSHSVYRSEKRNQRVETTCPSVFVNMWAGQSGQPPSLPPSLPPCLGPRVPWALRWDCPYRFFCGDKCLLITIQCLSQLAKNPNLFLCFQFCQVKRVKIPLRTASVPMQSESLIYTFISTCTNLYWLVPGLLIAWLYLMRTGIRAIFSWGKGWDRGVSEGQGLRTEKQRAAESGLRVRQFKCQGRAQRCLVPSVSYNPGTVVTMSILRILHISHHVAQFIMSGLITSHA